MALGLPGDFSFLIPKLETWSQIEKNPGSWQVASCRTGNTLVYKDGDAFLCSQTLKPLCSQNALLSSDCSIGKANRTSLTNEISTILTKCAPEWLD